GEGLNLEAVVGGLGGGDVHPGGQAADREAVPAAADRDRVAAAGAFDDHGVGGAVADAATGRAGQVEVHRGHAAPGEVVDGDLINPALGSEVDLLDLVEVHGDAGDVAGEEDARAVRRDVDLLGDVGAVEEHRVE